MIREGKKICWATRELSKKIYVGRIFIEFCRSKSVNHRVPKIIEIGDVMFKKILLFEVLSF